MNARNKCEILFNNPEFGLEQAVEALGKHGVSVERQDEQLLVQWHGGPVLYVSINREKKVHKRALALASGTPHIALRKCDARFEITFEDRSEVLDEINTLIVVQLALQDATQGFLFMNWNGQLQAPPDK